MKMMTFAEVKKDFSNIVGKYIGRGYYIQSTIDLGKKREITLSCDTNKEENTENRIVVEMIPRPYSIGGFKISSVEVTDGKYSETYYQYPDSEMWSPFLNDVVHVYKEKMEIK